MGQLDEVIDAPNTGCREGPKGRSKGTCFHWEFAFPEVFETGGF